MFLAKFLEQKSSETQDPKALRPLGLGHLLSGDAGP